MAGLLAGLGVGPGDRVGVMLANVPDFAVVYYGVLRAGGVVVPMNPLLKAREVAYYLGDSGATLLFAAAGVRGRGRRPGPPGRRAGGRRSAPTFLAELAGAAVVADGASTGTATDTAVILYTSGTTGTAQGRRADPRQPEPQRRGHHAATLLEARPRTT